MNDIVLFIFGFIATMMALGPLAVALIFDLISKNQDD
jgi:hypothetical protein